MTTLTATARHAAPTGPGDAPEDIPTAVTAYMAAERALSEVTEHAARLAAAADQLIGARHTVADAGVVLAEAASALGGAARSLSAATGELAAVSAAVRALDPKAHAAELAGLRRAGRVHTGLLLLLAVLGVLLLITAG